MKTIGTTILTLVILSALCIPAYALQVQVQTLVPQINANGGMAIGPDGKLYIADSFADRYEFGTTPGTQIFRVSMDGSIEEFANDLWGPIGIAFDAAGDLFVSQTVGSDFKANTIVRITPDGVVRGHASGMQGPSGLTIRSDGSIMVAKCGPGGARVTRVTPTKIATPFSNSNLLSCSLGAAFDQAENLYVSNLGGGAIIKFEPDATASSFATVGDAGTAGFLTYANDHLYVAGVGDPRIFQVNMDGLVTVLAGTGNVGNVDGPASNATFGWPWAITTSVTGDTLFVGDRLGGTGQAPGHPNVVRMITGVKSAIVTANEHSLEVPSTIALRQNYPNPFNPTTMIDFDIEKTEHVRLSVMDLLGREISILVDEVMTSGTHSVRFDASNLSTGAYLYRITTANQTVTKVMQLVR
jgi:sugar lactone lactonase YvrE